MSNPLNQLLAAAHNPVDASARALDVGALAADFVASANALVKVLQSEASVLRSAGTLSSDPKAVALARDFAYIDALIQATTKATTATWARLHDR
ncbi:hypothetical protein RBA41_31200 [Massilia sp. CCM 9210]|uniref:hypothetical protein n=1 Tax=Massilia scottii TaxID=3057166 RepID=UPI002796866A|nr:hypothetical protein [Massilia sp. CCM 9210]MDQ1817777.1 hypothetical protein [Massilia sp. CCM 9210]